MDFLEVGWKCGGHHNFADVVNEAGDVISLIGWGLDGGEHLAGHDGNPDAMLPELAPLEGGGAGELLEIFNHRRYHGQLSDLTHSQVKNGFLDAVHWGGHSEIDRVDEAEQPCGQAGVAADHLGDLRSVPLIG